jgi:Fe-S cluster biogenesis protein NfuA
METPKKIPVSVYAESTPNPEAMKFVSSVLLLENDETIELKSIDEARRISPIAFELFKFPFVRTVFIASNFITILKNDLLQWEDMTLQLRETIRDFIMNGMPAKKAGIDLADTDAKIPEVIKPITTDETSQKIMQILDEYVKPAVERDGGTIQFRSFKRGVVKVVMGGACSGCPSTTVTLKNGVEQLLKQMLPDKVREVDTDDV